MQALRVAIVAGENSGDALGGALIAALRALRPIECRGVAGPAMRAEGCEGLADAHQLAVMGLVEPLRHLPRLAALRARLSSHFHAWRPHVFVGIDAPAFNIGLAGGLRRRGIPTVQYVSPQVWAWRQGRVAKIARCVDLVLCLLPFEPAFYARHRVRAEFVGHPLADQVPLELDARGARAALGLPGEGPLLALLPGSRQGEVQRLSARFIAAARALSARRPDLTVAAAMASAPLARQFERSLAAAAAGGAVRVLDGQARTLLAAADVALVASGTATLEALLCRCPPVVAYRVSPATAWLARRLRLVRLSHFSLPNLLAGEELVPEFFQEAVIPANLCGALDELLADGGRRERLRSRFQAIHQSLQAGGAARAARAILELAAGDHYVAARQGVAASAGDGTES